MKNPAINRLVIAATIIISSGFMMSFVPTSPSIQNAPAITSSMVQSGDTVQIYLHNYTSTAITVHYHLEGNYNVVIKSKGGTSVVPPNEKVLIITTTVAGPGDWNTGNLKYNW